MADLKLSPRAALAEHPMPDLFAGAPGVTLTALPDGRQAILLARKGQARQLAERCGSFGVSLPLTPRRSESRSVGVVWTSPEQWLVDWHEGEANHAARLFSPFAALCTLVTADDARVRFLVQGRHARDTLAKLLTIDLHPRAFAPGDAAVTVAGGMSVILWQRDDSPAYVLALPRSVAASFWDWLVESAAEYGVTVEG